MAGQVWSESVANAIRRHVSQTGSTIFTRAALIEAEMQFILAVTGSSGTTPHQTLSRELQQLRDSGLIEFIGQGTYKWKGEASSLDSLASSKGVFVIGSQSIYEDEPERYYRFPPRWLSNAAKITGNWILYQEPRRSGKRGYYAAAKVSAIVRDPGQKDMYLALIEPGTFLEFGRDVPFKVQGKAIEAGLLNSDGRLNNGRAVQSIRSISDEDFDKIVAVGLIDEDELMPRTDDLSYLKEERLPWVGPVDRAKSLVSRTVRDRQFRKRVLEAYNSTCALTGMKLINGGGRAEAQAAHIMSVEAGGPDSTANGIALSGTVHWMFDRGLISLSDNGDILLSHKINDLDGVERLIYKDRRARLPESKLYRPHHRYLHWHRSECFHA